MQLARWFNLFDSVIENIEENNIFICLFYINLFPFSSQMCPLLSEYTILYHKIPNIQYFTIKLY